MTKSASPFIDTCRTRARAIQARAAEMGSTLALTQAYELLAAADGHRTWAAMRATGDTLPAAKPAPAASPSKYAGGRYVSLEISRQISLDSYDAVGDFDVPALLEAAYADLSFHFFDGEETPSMQFRGAHKDSKDEYTFIVDIEVPPGVSNGITFAEERMRHAIKDNIVWWRLAPREFLDFDPAQSDAAFPGSGNRTRDLPWTESAIMRVMPR